MHYTPGPWLISQNQSSDNCIVISDTTDTRALAVLDMIDDCDQANAQLISAAPEMLEALEDIACAFQSTEMMLLKDGGTVVVYHFEQDTIDTVLSLISRTRGKKG